MFIAQTRVDSGFMARFDATGPLVTALFAVLFLGKKLSLDHFGAFFLGTAGCFLIASPAADAEPAYLIATAGTVLFYAAGNVLYPILFSADENPVLISAHPSLCRWHHSHGNRPGYRDGAFSHCRVMALSLPGDRRLYSWPHPPPWFWSGMPGLYSLPAGSMCRR